MRLIDEFLYYIKSYLAKFIPKNDNINLNKKTQLNVT